MEWSQTIVTLVSVVISSGFLASVFYYKENKRAKQLQNDSSAATQWRELYEKSELAREKASAKIESLYKRMDVLRDERDHFKTQKAVLSIMKCQDLSCGNRVPRLDNKKTKELCQEVTETTTL